MTLFIYDRNNLESCVFSYFILYYLDSLLFIPFSSVSTSIVHTTENKESFFKLNNKYLQVKRKSVHEFKVEFRGT